MDKLLRRLQLTQLEILRRIDDFCSEEKISYSLYAGTLLGAVRHRGFIPWDDDLDICMERTEYDRFVAAWIERGPAGFLLQNKENTPLFTQSFSKIRKDHTTFLQYDFERGRYHTGIFVDVFPIDRLPENELARLWFTWNCLRYQLYSREFVPPKGNPVEKAISSVLLAAVPPEKRQDKRRALLNKITRNSPGKEETVAIETFRTIRTPLPADLLEDYVRLSFEDGEYMCFKNWDGYLRAKFGDYMTLPPESERTWTHHPIVIDFEHNYEELSSQKV